MFQGKSEIKKFSKTVIGLLMEANLKIFGDEDKLDLKSIEEISKNIVKAIEDQAKSLSGKKKPSDLVQEL